MMREADRYARMHEILAAARCLPESEVDSFLARSCEDDTGLRREVTELLALGQDESDRAAFAEAQLEGSRQAIQDLFEDSNTEWLPDGIGPYTITRRLGSGGMGVVYEARQEAPRRRVAIKLLHPMRTTAERLRRFRREADVLGRLQHPGIAQIFETGTFDAGHGEQPYFAMELVEGVDIRTHCAREGLDLRQKIALCAEVADAIQYAHERGVVHRDLKPDNVLVDGDGRARVLDFGIARVTEDASTDFSVMTREGQLVGTLGYMAPEMLGQRADASSPQVDVYALGVLAFEVVTGRAPRNLDSLAIPQAVAHLTTCEPLRAGSVDARYRGDIEVILGKALASERSRRYESAAAFAGDLRRFLADRPILARPPSRTYLLGKFARRHRALVAGTLATLAVALIGAIVAASYAIEANQRAYALERAAYVGGLAVASAAIDRLDYDGAAAELDGLPSGRGGWELDHLRAQLVHHTDAWELPHDLVSALGLVEGRVLGVTARAQLVSWDAETGEVLESRSIAALAGREELRAGQVIFHWDLGRIAVLRPDDSVVVSSLAGEVLDRYDLVDGRASHLRAWSGDGTTIAAGHDGQVSLLRDGTVWKLDGVADGPIALAHDGSSLSWRSKTYGRIVRSTDAGVEVAHVDIGDAGLTLCESPDGRLLAIGGEWGGAYLVDLATFTVEEKLAGHDHQVVHVAWNEDGSSLLTCALDGWIRVWNVSSGHVTAVQDAGAATWPSGVFLPDRHHVLATGSSDLRRFLVSDSGVLRGHESYVYRLGFSEDGRLLASAGYQEEQIFVWDVASASLVGRYASPRLIGPGGIPHAAALLGFAAGGTELVATSTAESKRYEISTGQLLWEDTEPVDIAGTRHARQMADPDHRVWQNDQALTPDERAVYWVNSMAQPGIRMSEREVQQGSPWRDRGGYASLLEESQPSEGPFGRHAGRMYCIDFHPDGTRFATGGVDGKVRIWDAQTHEQLLVLHGHERYVFDIQFSPDGTLLASASGDRTIRLWDTIPLHERRSLAREK